MTIGNQYILKSFLKFDLGFIYTLIHMMLGVMATLSPYPIIAWYYFVIIDTARAYIVAKGTERNVVLAYAILYFSSFELIGRMSSSSPFIPYESSKYIMMLLSIVGIMGNLDKVKISNPGFILLLLLIPSLFVDVSGVVTMNDFIFNVFGLFNIAFALIFFSLVRIGKWNFVKMIRLLAFPLIPVLIYTFLKTPDYSDLEFELSANFDTTGGFGSNQVSTVLGLGSFLFAIGFILNYRISGNKILDLILLAGFTVQGLLTFSRGGMLGAVIGLIVLVYFLMKMGNKELAKFKIPNPKKYVIPVLVAFVVFFMIGNLITGGNLVLRYQGQTAGTMTGRHEIDLNKFTSNRWELLIEDLWVWQANPVFGSGAAASKYLRFNTNGEVAHVEFSRLIAEHGIFGILVIILFVRIYFLLRNSKMDGLNKAILISFFMLGIYTSFHAATRTFLTPLLVSMSAMGVVEPRSSKKNKSLAEQEKKKPSFTASQI